jgi:hypothetical protein
MIEKKIVAQKIWLLLKIKQSIIQQQSFWAMPKNISVTI